MSHKVVILSLRQDSATRLRYKPPCVYRTQVCRCYVFLPEDAIRHPPKVVLVENGFLIPNHYPNPKPKPNPKPNFGYQ